MPMRHGGTSYATGGPDVTILNGITRREDDNMGNQVSYPRGKGKPNKKFPSPRMKKRAEEKEKGNIKKTCGVLANPIRKKGKRSRPGGMLSICGRE